MSEPLPFKKKLLAKSRPPKGERQGAAMFTGHIGAVMRAADVLIKELGPKILEQLGLQDVLLEKFSATVKLGAYLHDWGKANEHFQIMVRLRDSKYILTDQEKKFQKQLHQRWRDLNQRQMLRHEIISGLLALQVPAFRSWLTAYPSVDLMVAVWAAMGHHLKIGGRRGSSTDSIAELVEGTGSSLLIYTHHRHFKALLRMGVKYLGLPEELPALPKEKWSTDEITKHLRDLHEQFVDFEETLDEPQHRFIAAVKATVIAADIAGSALPKAGYSLESWIKEVLELVLSQEDIQQLINIRLEGKQLRPFQEQIAQSQQRITIARAGCGTGKTLAAYAWGKNHAVGRKLFFGYPTTGTASQGFIDYAAQTKIERTLMHSRASIDLERILFSQEAQYERSDAEDPERVDARLASFTAWQAKLIVCTVDTVLGLMQNNRKPLYAWPALCQSAFVFDEVHAYDNQLFGALLRFLKTFRGAKILLMSASFTESQLSALRNVVEHELGETVNIIDGPLNLELLLRYEVHQLDKEEDAWPQVFNVVQAPQNNKVLWVTNTVKDCVRIYQEAKSKLKDLDVDILIYHSRFKYQDRIEKHTRVVESFGGVKPVIAITTQVCEMSLDLSAHLLVSAMAPATALIQRMGRLNRKVEVNNEGITQVSSGQICGALIYPWTHPAPYQEELSTGAEFLALLPDGAIHQQHLATAVSQLNLELKPVQHSNWLDGHWRSFPGSLREAGYTLTVLLDEDVPKIQAKICKDHSFAQEALNWTVPITIPKKVQYASWPKQGLYPVAPGDVVTYSSELGAQIWE